MKKLTNIKPPVKKVFYINLVVLILVGTFTLSPAARLLAQMSSSNYEISSDSINFAGERSESTNFRLDDSLGQTSSGISNSSSFALNAGFQQIEDYEISIATSGDVNLGPVSGLSSSSADGTLEVTVTTNDPSGYELAIKSNSTPAMQTVGDSFADYAPEGLMPDFDFEIEPGESLFGFAIDGVDADGRYRNNSSACATGSSSTPLKCWDGLNTTDKVIGNKLTKTSTSGSTTNVNFRAATGGDVIKKPGAYSATVVITAVSL